MDADEYVKKRLKINCGMTAPVGMDLDCLVHNTGEIEIAMIEVAILATEEYVSMGKPMSKILADYEFDHLYVREKGPFPPDIRKKVYLQPKNETGA